MSYLGKIKNKVSNLNLDIFDKVVIVLIIISSIFILGMVDSYAYSGDYMTKEEWESKYNSLKSEYAYHFSFQKLHNDTGLSDDYICHVFTNEKVRVYINGGKLSFYNEKGDSVVKCYALEFFNRYDDGKLIDINGYLHTGVVSGCDYPDNSNINYSNFDIYGKDGKLVFQKRPMEEVKQLIPAVKADSLVIVMTVGVFLIGLYLLLRLLSKVLKRFSRS